MTFGDEHYAGTHRKTIKKAAEAAYSSHFARDQSDLLYEELLHYPIIFYGEPIDLSTCAKTVRLPVTQRMLFAHRPEDGGTRGALKP